MKLKRFQLPTVWDLKPRIPIAHFGYAGMMAKIETTVEFDSEREVFRGQTVYVAPDKVNYYELNIDNLLPYPVDRDCLIAAGHESFFSRDGYANEDYYRLLQAALDALMGGRHD